MGDVVILKDRFPQIRAATRRAAIATLKDGADRILRQAKKNVVAYDAIDTGNMLNSGYVRTSTYDGFPSQVMFPGMRLPAPRHELEIAVNFAAGYALWVHEPTIQGEGRPFLTDAVVSVLPFFRNRYRAALREAGL
jgi:hypothetical protein